MIGFCDWTDITNKRKEMRVINKTTTKKLKMKQRKLTIDIKKLQALNYMDISFFIFHTWAFLYIFYLFIMRFLCQFFCLFSFGSFILFNKQFSYWILSHEITIDPFSTLNNRSITDIRRDHVISHIRCHSRLKKIMKKKENVDEV